MKNQFNELAALLAGELYFDDSPQHQVQLLAYSTDASVYQEKPKAVALPKTVADIQALVHFANEQSFTLIPRAAGTSLAGQVVGNGLVVDISKNFNQIIEVNVAEKWVHVQVGVIRDDLNSYLKGFGLMFGPETSTANRAMIGGMVGNNSCGLHSIVWGSARDHLLEASVVWSDGSIDTIGSEPIQESIAAGGTKGKIFGALHDLLADTHHQELICDNFPVANVVRRNTGYALDALLHMQPYTADGAVFNVCKLIAGSEGTLAFITEVRLNLIDLPPQEVGVVCIHCNSIDESLRANIIALKHGPMASELVDKFIMDFTIGHPEYHKNRFFIEGDPKALLMVEFMESTKEKLDQKIEGLIADLKAGQKGYAHPVLYNADTKFAWDIRKAGLGLLRNLKGDAQPVNLIEDCAVSTDDLSDYIAELAQLLERYGVQASYYAHAGAGELHVEPIINLKNEEGLKQFRGILTETAALVKKYNGSLSGEHGDGRLRGEFIASMVGAPTNALFKEVKNIFDPKGIFNAGKITNTPAMDSHLRIQEKNRKQVDNSIFDFSEDGGILRLTEKCSGSGDCRKTEISGGLMCPSYMATRKEKDTTRARANVLRQFLSNSSDLHPYDHAEIKEAMDLCLSCKGCKIECPSSIDITKMKAEFLQHYYDANGTPMRAKMIGGFSSQMEIASRFSWVYNLVFDIPWMRRITNTLVGFHPERTMPLLAATTLRKWHAKQVKINTSKINGNKKQVYFFCDEFTNYLDVAIGQKTILLLEALGHEVIIPNHLESARTYLSKGLVRKAKAIINQNIELLGGLIDEAHPLIGIEPSAILTLRDEYIDLADTDNKSIAKKIASCVFTIEEFIATEVAKGNIHSGLFHNEAKQIALHGHCYQKVLSSQDAIKNILSLPENYSVTVIPSGCCGMAGSFGYEKEHYAVSQQVGELVLFPAVRKLSPDHIIAAAGTSCRHQIKDGTQVHAMHPVEILYDALIK